MSRGMNMRDMKARQMGKSLPSPRPGLQRGRREQRCAAPPERLPEPQDGDEPELLDEVEEAVHQARADGHFAPVARFSLDADDERDCPDEPPPGWCDT